MMHGDAATLGRRTARDLLARGRHRGARAFARLMGVAIVERPSPPPAQLHLRSEYRPNPPEIILYREPLDKLHAAMDAELRSAITRRKLDELHVAHELFHHLECSQRFGRISRDQAEQAAHAFAQTLLGLDFPPSELAEAAP